LYTQHFRPSMWFAQLAPLNADLTTWHSNLLGPTCLKWTGPSKWRLRESRPRGMGNGGDKVTESIQSAHSRPTLSAILATGWDSVSLIDPDQGTLLATHRLPCRPTHSPTLLRLSQSDTDRSIVGSEFIIPCEGMLLAFGVVYEIRLVAFILTVLSLFGSFLMIHLCCQFSLLESEY
uniref:WD_REPEATS_REGION domain-containing protein n=1 Tax=Echinostoma caproni TaxID=27848 RepID=A0A183AQL5_9TREM